MGIERAVEHPNDFRGFVVHDGPLAAVPQYRYGDDAGKARLRHGVDFVKVLFTVQGIGGSATGFAESPPLWTDDRFHHRDRDDGFKTFERAYDQGAMSPGTTKETYR